MAIYRTGQASMDAQGYVTGYGTKWRAQLTLIRPGATIVFNTSPATFAVVSQVIDDTNIRAVTTGGAVVQRSDYVILLHDSLTVDGLAQDVAETLRYYQGKETEFAHLIEALKTLDYEKLEALVQRIEQESEQFEQNIVEIDKRVKQVEANAQKVEQLKADTTAIKDQAEAFKNQAAASEENAARQVVLAIGEVDKARAEVQKAEQEAVKANQEFLKAKAEATRVQEIVDGAKQEVVQSAAAEVQKATEQADRAKQEADRAADLATGLDATNLLRKDRNLSDLTDKAAARENLGVDFIYADDEETKLMSKDHDHWIVMRPSNGTWGFYDGINHDWYHLGIEQGGTGAGTVEGARSNLKVNRLIQDANMTRIKSSDEKTEMRIGYDDWYVYRDSQDSEAGFVALGVKGGGTGGTSVQEAKENLEIARFKQESDRTRFVTPDGLKSFSLANGGAWGVYDNNGGWIPLSIQAGGTGGRNVTEAKDNLEIGSFHTIPGAESRMYWPKNRNRYVYLNDSGSWGCYDLNENGAIPLGLGSGGTGATDVAGARRNLGVDTVQQAETETMLRGPQNSSYRITLRSNNEWGVWNDAGGGWKALNVDAGGTGANDDRGARKNLNVPTGHKRIPDGTNVLGWLIENGEAGYFTCGDNLINLPEQGHGWWTLNFVIHQRDAEGIKPAFGMVTAVSAANRMYIIKLDTGSWPNGWFEVYRQNSDTHYSNVNLDRHNMGSSGELIGNRIHGGVLKSNFGLYNEFQDNVSKVTLRCANNERNVTAWLQWDENGSLWNVKRMMTNDMLFGSHGVKAVSIRAGTMLVDGTATPYYDTFGNPEGRRSVTEFGTREDGWIMYAQVNSNLSKQVDVNGVVNAHAFNQTSDRDLKDDIEVIDDALGKVRMIGGYTYTMKDDGMPYAGVIAQEVREALPEASGSFTKYVDLPGPTKDGNSLRGEERYYSVDYSGITALLVQACKEMDVKITKLEEENEALKGALSSIDEMKKEIEYIKSLLNKAR